MTPRLPPAFLTVPLAHRALHDVTDGRPENSRAAIAAAIEGGYGIEIDLQLSADNRAMVFHDYALDRLTTQTGPVRQRDADNLAQVSLRGGDEAIPTLEEILALVDGRAPLLIDSHGREVADPVWALLDFTLARSGPRPLLIEWDNDVPAWPVLAVEATRAAQALNRLSAPATAVPA